MFPSSPPTWRCGWSDLVVLIPWLGVLGAAISATAALMLATIALNVLCRRRTGVDLVSPGAVASGVIEGPHLHGPRRRRQRPGQLLDRDVHTPGCACTARNALERRPPRGRIRLQLARPRTSPRTSRTAVSAATRLTTSAVGTEPNLDRSALTLAIAAEPATPSRTTRITRSA